MLRKSIYAALAVLAGLGVAQAADMPVKAAPKPFLAYPADSGFYFGVGTFGEAQGVKVQTPVPGGANGYAAGAGGAIIGGYQRTFGQTAWVAVEAGFSYAGTGTNAACGGVGFACALNANFSASQKIKVGGSILNVIAMLPDLSTDFPVLPVIPPGQANPSMNPYVMAVAHESREDVSTPIGGSKKVAVRVGLGAGVLTQLKAGMVLDSWAEFTFRADSFGVAPGVTAIPGGQGRAGMSILW